VESANRGRRGTGQGVKDRKTTKKVAGKGGETSITGKRQPPAFNKSLRYFSTKTNSEGGRPNFHSKDVGGTLSGGVHDGLWGYSNISIRGEDKTSRRGRGKGSSFPTGPGSKEENKFSNPLSER